MRDRFWNGEETMNRYQYRRALVALFGVLALLGVACSGDDDDSTATETTEPNSTEEPAPSPAPEVTEEPAPTEAPEATEEPAPTEAPQPTEQPEPTEEPAEPEPTEVPEAVRGEIAESFVGAVLAQHSGDPIGGEVKVYWNNGSNGTLIALYHGEGMADLEGLCPGNSLQTASGFEFVTNTPAAPGACDDFPTPTASLRVCTSAVVLYETAIPNDSEGTLWGSLEWRGADGAIVGMTSQSVNTPGTPEIDYAADAYDLSAMFTIDGSTEITCDPPVS